MDQTVCTVDGGPCAAAVLLLQLLVPTLGHVDKAWDICPDSGMDIHAAIQSACRSTNGGSGPFIGGEYGLL
jgi:hypothetical protein